MACKELTCIEFYQKYDKTGLSFIIFVFALVIMDRKYK